MQIIAILRKQESGGEGGERVPLARDQQHHVLRLDGQVRGMEIAEVKRLKALKDEDARLKRLLAEATLDGEPFSAIAPRTMASTQRDLLSGKR